MDKLTQYNKKRNFKKTAEPKGKLLKTDKSNKLRFVIQHHIATKDHYDLRLEWSGVFLSWAVPKGPSFNPTDKRLAVKVEDHPLGYGNFEGTIPAGEYGAGTVMLWDSGEWFPFGDVKKNLKNGAIKFKLIGKRLNGNWTLIKLKNDTKGGNWLLIKEKDEFAKTKDGISGYDKSIKTNRTMNEIANNALPKTITTKAQINEIIEQIKKSLKIKSGEYFVEKIKITSPDKIIFKQPNIKKIDIVLYYNFIAKFMLPFVKNRLMTVVRCPQGINSACFYKKHPKVDREEIKSVKIKNSQNETEEYFYLETVSGIVFEAQMDTLEFHPWGTHIKNLEKPDMMIFDFDPGKNLEIEKLRQGVKDLKSILDELKLKSYLKTSGGKGYHVVIPFKPSADWQTFNDFAKNIALVMEQKWPEKYTSNMRKDKRKGKIFIDWLRNGKGATAVAPYSLRARKNAPISMPIYWEELDTVTPNQFTISNFYERILQNPWKNFLKVKQELKMPKIN